MEISHKNIHEIRREGKNIVLQYNTKEAAAKAYFEQYNKTVDEINKALPQGVF